MSDDNSCPDCGAANRMSHYANHKEGCFVAQLLQHRSELQENLGDCVQDLDTAEEEIARLNKIINQMIK